MHLFKSTSHFFLFFTLLFVNKDFQINKNLLGNSEIENSKNHKKVTLFSPDY